MGALNLRIRCVAFNEVTTCPKFLGGKKGPSMKLLARQAITVSRAVHGIRVVCSLKAVTPAEGWRMVLRRLR